jgi:hypothetical protein
VEAARFAFRHPGQAKREPGSQKKHAFITIPDSAPSFRDDDDGDPLTRQKHFVQPFAPDLSPG